jgi:hypothetical protein
MIGIGLRGRFARRTHKEIVKGDNSRNVRASVILENPEAQLLKQFQNLHISIDKKSIVEKSTIKLFCPRFQYVQKRSYFTSLVLYKRISKDMCDLNEKGLIKDEILRQRKAFLKEHSMLENKIDYLGRPVYANYYLYDVNQIDMIGRSNLQRMLCGICPIDKTGKDILSIHHFDQTMDGPWIILPGRFHQEQTKKLHSEVSLANGVNKQRFAKERIEYWKYQASLELELRRSIRPSSNL